MSTRTDVFRNAYLLKFGISVVDSNGETHEVTKVVCRFCQKFGREAREGAMRAVISEPKTWEKFRCDMFKQHLNVSHPTRWAEYQPLGKNSKQLYFDVPGVVPFNETIDAHFPGRQGSMVQTINREIVDAIIGDMFFDPNKEIDPKERALSIFQNDPTDASLYVVNIKLKLQFRTVVRLLGAGMTFRMVEATARIMKDESVAPKLGIINRNKVSQFTRIVCAINFQSIAHILQHTWAFSIAMDMSTHQSHSYLDIRIRLYAKGELHNFHLAAVPMFTEHSADQIYDHAKRVLDVLCPQWSRKIISITTDGERKMTGSIRGVATQFSNTAGDGFFRIWCGLHQLDLCLQRFYSALMEKLFYKTLTKLIGYLRRQFSLKDRMGTQVPLVADTRWESMSKVATWLLTHHVVVIAYLREKESALPSSPPVPALWWVILTGVSRIASEATNTFRFLEGKTTLVCQQRAKISMLIHHLVTLFSISGPLDPRTFDAANFPVDEYSVSSKQKFVVKHTDMKTCFESWGGFVLNILQTASVREELPGLIVGFSTCVVNFVEHVVEVSAERDARNGVGDEMPLILPQQLAKTRGAEFTNRLVEQQQRLLHSMQQQDIDTIESDLVALQIAYRQEQDVQIFLDGLEATADFDTSWGNPLIKGRFAKLRTYCGGLATAFPGTSTVESDFSILKWEKDDSRSRLSDFSLEGVMQAKQYHALNELQANRNHWN